MQNSQGEKIVRKVEVQLGGEGEWEIYALLPNLFICILNVKACLTEKAETLM